MVYRIVSRGAMAGAVVLVLAVPVSFAIRPALAADLDQPYLGSQQFPQDKVEFGSGWYIRGDIAATQNYALGLEQEGTQAIAFGVARTSNWGYDASIGGGYKFLNGIRTDIVVDFHQPVQTNISGNCIDTAGICSIQGKFNHNEALLNGYYDLGTWWKVTPYLGAGAGVGFGEAKASVIGGTNLYVANTKYQNFAFALMAGVGFDVYDHTKLDIGYRYLNDGSVGGEKIYHHEIRAGLRYMIDE